MDKNNPHQLYKKLFIIYTIMIVCIVAALQGYFTAKIKTQYKETSLTYMNVVFDKALSYIKKSSSEADKLLNTLYQSNEELQDVVNYLQDDIEIYLKKRLDAFAGSASLYYGSIDKFSQKALEANDNIKTIGFISYQKAEMTKYHRNGRTQIIKYHLPFEDLVSVQNYEGENAFSFRKEIRDPVNLNNIGCMILEYNTSALREAYEFYPEGDLTVFYSSGKVIFDSAQSLYAADWLYDGQIQSLNVVEKQLKSYVLHQNIDQIHIGSYVSMEQADRIPLFLWITINGIGLILIIISIFFIHLHLKKLSKRLNNILEGMEMVKKGDLNVRLAAGKESDELDVIAGHFNRMCSELNTYIEKSYLMEIEQKNAEMNALQSQINPHFLYNTLESIRMKAICNGDKEVGKMLYGLAVIFRSLVKEDNIITIAKELHYCKKYLELFQFRYQKKFQFQIECESHWLPTPIIKFIIQPVIENYFIHGIRLDEEDNYIKITVMKNEDILLIHVIDNGRGMSKEEVEKKNEELLHYKSHKTGGSIGLYNVQYRIRTEYGERYGITLENNEDKGLHVIFHIPCDASPLMGSCL